MSVPKPSVLKALPDLACEQPVTKFAKHRPAYVVTPAHPFFTTCVHNFVSEPNAVRYKRKLKTCTDQLPEFRTCPQCNEIRPCGCGPLLNHGRKTKLTHRELPHLKLDASRPSTKQSTTRPSTRQAPHKVLPKAAPAARSNEEVVFATTKTYTQKRLINGPTNNSVVVGLSSLSSPLNHPGAWQRGFAASLSPEFTFSSAGHQWRSLDRPVVSPTIQKKNKEKPKAEEDEDEDSWLPQKNVLLTYQPENDSFSAVVKASGFDMHLQRDFIVQHKG
eukprot:TRINITY_DN86421_c0_g1_i1.p1 TRINITY_DN86421_c0_g1~~TRINITY_DN86421_c0_g1_i1.p1  ORF type:complete len:275 (-),score=14.25 TRINITY_DN86421_c0_g1_i1:81-905(-)